MCEQCQDGPKIPKAEFIARFTANTRKLFEVAMQETDREDAKQAAILIGESIMTLARIRRSDKTEGPLHLVEQHEALVAQISAMTDSMKAEAIFAPGVRSASAH